MVSEMNACIPCSFYLSHGWTLIEIATQVSILVADAKNNRLVLLSQELGTGSMEDSDDSLPPTPPTGADDGLRPIVAAAQPRLPMASLSSLFQQ